MHDNISMRRDLLWQLGGGLGGVALAAWRANDGLLADERAAVPSNASQHQPQQRPVSSQRPHHSEKANAVIQTFCSGGPSHVDTWDYKPELERRAGQPFDPDGKLTFFASKLGNCQPSYWKFRQRGQCGR